MKKICIFGSGGFAKEVFWLANQCGKEVEAFIDVEYGGYCCDKKIESEEYFDPTKHYAVIAVGDSQLRKKIVSKIRDRHRTEDIFETLISPSANLMSKTIEIGYGSVVCANCIITCDVKLGAWSQLNLATTIGHDTTTGQFFTTAPGVHISGKVNAGECVYFGTNASSIESIDICNNVVIGAAACVAKDIVDPGIYVGIPAKKLIRK